MRAIVSAFLCALSQPVRNFSVTGTSTAATTASSMEATKISSCNKAEPHHLLHTFFTGQPMLISMICAPLSTLKRAASANICGSAPAICTALGSISPS